MGISVPLKEENEVVRRPVVIALDAHVNYEAFRVKNSK